MCNGHTGTAVPWAHCTVARQEPGVQHSIKQILLTVVRMIVAYRRLQKERKLLAAKQVLGLLGEIFSVDIESLRSDYIPTGGGKDR